MASLQDDLTAEFAATAEDILARLQSNRSVTGELAADGFSRTAWSAVAGAGWLEALAAEPAGGLGLSLRELGPIFSAAGRHLLVGPLAEHAVAGALAASVATGGTQDRLLASLQGEVMLAVVDAAAAGDHSGSRPTLERGTLTGVCELVRFGTLADELLVVAGTAGGPTIVLVPAGREGVDLRGRPSLDPVTLQAAVRLTDVEVGGDDVVASGDEAWGLLARTRAAMRVAIACELSGIADHALALAVAYAKERHQFGRPIGSFQALQHILAEMAREAFGLARLCREAAATAADEPEAVEDAARVAKAHAAAVARSVTEGSLQVHGGVAFTVEHELYRYYTHVLLLEGLYGDRDELHEELGRRLLAATGEVWPAWS